MDQTIDLTKDFTPTGLKIEGKYENDRNIKHSELFKAIIREVYGATDVIVAHHLTYVAVDKQDGFDIQIVEEIPSADALIFDHDVAQKLWGQHWAGVLQTLALTPVEERDALLGKLYYSRQDDEGRPIRDIGPVGRLSGKRK